MKPLSIAASLSLLILTAEVALAPGAGAQPAARAALTGQQLDIVRAHVRSERRPSDSVPPDFVPALGAEVPRSIAVFWMPPSVGLYRYAVVNERILVLDNDDRGVVEILHER